MRYEQPPPEPLASALGFLLSWNGKRLAHLFEESLEPLGLRPTHFGVMNLIAAKPGCAQQELVEGAMIDPSSMVKLIDELEGMGLAERRVAPPPPPRPAAAPTAPPQPKPPRAPPPGA